MRTSMVSESRPDDTDDHAQVEEELPPSKLGTKQHWDDVYDRENAVFEDIGDEGEVWFGESSVKKMRQWAVKHLPPSDEPIRVLECGSGNGTLLLSFLTSPADVGQQAFNLTGIDYSEGSTRLSRSIEQHRRDHLEDEIDEDEEVINPVTVSWRTGDLLRNNIAEHWDLVLDKGTFDALALSQEVVSERGGRLPSLVYPEQVAKLVKSGGFFLITSCNFTEEEIKRRWTRAGLGFEYHSSVPHKSYTFGGRTGTVVCTVAFKKTSAAATSDSLSGLSPGSNRGETSSVTTTSASGSSRSKSQCDDLYICIDCGGTKTDVAIASRGGEMLSRAKGKTGNMAEVGAELCRDIICETVTQAISNLPERYRAKWTDVNVKGKGKGKEVCPVDFADIWIGISGCDTPSDQKLLSTLLSPFFSRSYPPILNDAHLLAGPLLQHGCPWGIAVIAGTGSVVVALQVDGGEVKQVGRRGGLGYLLGDDGSGFDLGRWAIRFAIDAFDAGDESPGGLAEDIRRHFDVDTTPEVLRKVYDLDHTLSPIDATNLRKLQISSLAIPVLAAFNRSPPDPVAVLAVNAAADLLAESVTSLVHQLLSKQHAAGSESGSSPNGTDLGRNLKDAALVMGGGLIRQVAYRGVVLRKLAERGIRFGREEVVDDVAGQGALGLAQLGR